MGLFQFSISILHGLSLLQISTRLNWLNSLGATDDNMGLMQKKLFKMSRPIKIDLLFQILDLLFQI